MFSVKDFWKFTADVQGIIVTLWFLEIKKNTEGNDCGPELRLIIDNEFASMRATLMTLANKRNGVSESEVIHNILKTFGHSPALNPSRSKLEKTVLTLYPW